MRTGNSHLKDLLYGVPVTDGAGVKLNRIIGSYRLAQLDPFLLLDEFKSDDPDDYAAGFPAHPHRGFETVTYMLEGRFQHRDSRNGSGVLEAGGVQWMTAGRGVIHSEMPIMEHGRLWGYQLWLNLPAAEKMVEPRYVSIAPDDIPWIVGDGVLVKIISGRYGNYAGPVQPSREIDYFDVQVVRKGTFIRELPSDKNICLLVHSGSVIIDPDGEAEEVPAGSLVIPEPDMRLTVRAAEENAGFLYLAAAPLNEPVARSGPFVMNTEQEIRQAYADYRNGRLG